MNLFEISNIPKEVKNKWKKIFLIVLLWIILLIILGVFWFR